MKALGLLLFAGVIIVVIYLYAQQTGGAPAGAGSTANDAVNGVKNGATGAAEAFYRQPWFWTAAVAAGLATVGLITWKKIGGWGRAVVLVCAAIAVTVIVTKAH